MTATATATAHSSCYYLIVEYGRAAVRDLTTSANRGMSRSSRRGINKKKIAEEGDGENGTAEGNVKRRGNRRKMVVVVVVVVVVAVAESCTTRPAIAIDLYSNKQTKCFSLSLVLLRVICFQACPS